jgi:hypothetical protein
MNDRPSANALEFATFWHGPLDAMTYSCLASFPAVSAALCIYSYDLRLAPPPGVELADARLICPDPSLISRFLAFGKPSLAKFADMFRYKLIRDTGCCWVDTDVICLRKPDLSRDPIVFGNQSNPYGETLINNAVLKLPPDHPLLKDLIGKAEGAVDIDQKWGAIGPFLLTELVVKRGMEREARPSAEFYPVEPDDFWRLLLPECRGSVAAWTQESTFLHLWGEMFKRCAYDMKACPPPGSFLHEIFDRLGTTHRFDRVYDAKELAGVLAGWINEDDYSHRTGPAGNPSA